MLGARRPQAVSQVGSEIEANRVGLGLLPPGLEIGGGGKQLVRRGLTAEAKCPDDQLVHRRVCTTCC